MANQILTFLVQQLTKPSSFFGIKVWILIALCVALVAFTLITLLCLCWTGPREKKTTKKKLDDECSISTTLDHIKNNDTNNNNNDVMRNSIIIRKEILPPRISKSSSKDDVESAEEETSPERLEPWASWRRSTSLKEITVATNEFDKYNVIGFGDYGTVYLGVLFDGSRVAIKKLLINSCSAKDFKLLVEEIRLVRHKNLVNLIGYCMEGPYRTLVYEYIDNKSLHYWLHQCPGEISPVNWFIRIHIILGIAKGLAYLHDGIEPRIAHGNLKSSNVLLDYNWNPKLTNFGLTKLFSPRLGLSLMEGLGYIAPEDFEPPYKMTEKKDVYTFGILVMEIITGRKPIDRRRHEAYLVDWVKSRISSGNIEEVVDPKMDEMPIIEELKRTVLIALRCVDLDENNRPSIEDVTHMFEPRDLLLDDF